MPLDIAIGIIVAVVTANITGLPFTTSLISVCIIFALLPDLDFIFRFVRRDKENILHAPVPYIVFGTLMLAIQNPLLAILFAVLSFIHFLHDTFSYFGPSIRWWYPITKKHYKFFAHKNSGAKKKQFALELLILVITICVLVVI